MHAVHRPGVFAVEPQGADGVQVAVLHRLVERLVGRRYRGLLGGERLLVHRRLHRHQRSPALFAYCGSPTAAATRTASIASAAACTRTAHAPCAATSAAKAIVATSR